MSIFKANVKRVSGTVPTSQYTPPVEKKEMESRWTAYICRKEAQTRRTCDDEKRTRHVFINLVG